MKLDPKHWSKAWLAPLLASASAFGCGHADPSSGAGTSRAGEPPLEAPLSGDSALQAAGPSVLFEDSAADAPGIKIVDLGEGRMAVMVTAPIGTPLPTVPDGSLAELYRAVHPESGDLPPAVARASASEADIRRRWQENRRSLPDLDEPGPALIEKSQSSFNSTVCRTFNEGANVYYAHICGWANAWIVTTSDIPGPHVDSLKCYDRSYAWNNSSTHAGIVWYQPYTPPYTGYYNWNLAAYTWTWVSVYCGDPNARYTAEVANTGPNPEVGVTWHKWVPIVP